MRFISKAAFAPSARQRHVRKACARGKSQRRTNWCGWRSSPGLYTSHFDYLIEVLDAIGRRRKSIEAYRITERAPFCGTSPPITNKSVEPRALWRR
jgi:hypothetical protein